MKLRERFKKQLQDNAKIQLSKKGDEVEISRYYDIDAESCEKIADDFAIGFANWLRENTAQVKGGRYKLFKDFEIYNLKELLAIFKQTL